MLIMMPDIMDKLTFPLERSSAMRLMGILWTGSVSGQILVGSLLLIGVLFMGKLGFSPLSIIFFIIFIVPMALILHHRLVRKGKHLMVPWCEIELNGDELRFQTGFPNTMNPKIQLVTITDKNRDILLKGGEDTGYQLQLSGDTFPVIKLGLWINFEDAEKSANDLKKLLKGKILDKSRKNVSETED